MSSEFDEFNRLMMEEMKKKYSEKAIDYLANPRNIGPVEGANGYASLTDPDGEELTMWLNIEDNVVKKATFYTKGCTAIVIAASGLAELLPGKTLEEAEKITPKALRDFIGRTPRQTWHCTVFAVDVLKVALKNYVILSRLLFNRPGYKSIQIDL